MHRADWNVKQNVSAKIVKQLSTMNEEEQKAWILKLLEHVEETFIVALDLAYEITPEPEKKQNKEVETTIPESLPGNGHPAIYNPRYDENS